MPRTIVCVVSLPSSPSGGGGASGGGLGSYEGSSGPAIGYDGTIFVGARDAKVYALDGTTGALK